MSVEKHQVIIDLEKWRETNVVKHKPTIQRICGTITGRICYNKNLFTLIFLKQHLPDFKVYLEIGSLFGASLALMMQQKKPATFIGIDFFDGYYGKNKDPSTKIKPTLELVTENIDKCNHYRQNYKLIQGSSYDPKTISKFADLNLKIDLFYIDGDHSYYGATVDFLNYYPFFNKGAFIVFDNYTDWPGVQMAVERLDFPELKCEIIGRFKSGFIVKYNG